MGPRVQISIGGTPGYASDDAGVFRRKAAESKHRSATFYWRLEVTIRADSFKEFVLDQLCSLGGMRCRAMFGGYGLYRKDDFFGIIFKSRLYLKTDSRTRSVYLERGMKAFRPNPKQELQTYYEVPIEVIEDCDELARWASEALRCPSRRGLKVKR